MSQEMCCFLVVFRTFGDKQCFTQLAALPFRLLSVADFEAVLRRRSDNLTGEYLTNSVELLKTDRYCAFVDGEVQFGKQEDPCRRHLCTK